MTTQKEANVAMSASEFAQGTTTISDIVVARIASLAAREVPGVHALGGGGIGGAIADIAVKMTGAYPRGQGIDVEVGKRETAVDLKLSVEYGVSIPDVADAIRRNVEKRVTKMTGLIVKEVNIQITDLHFPNEAPPKEAPPRVE